MAYSYLFPVMLGAYPFGWYLTLVDLRGPSMAGAETCVGPSGSSGISVAIRLGSCGISGSLISTTCVGGSYTSIYTLGISTFTFLLLLLFWAGLSDPLACPLLGGGIPSQNSGYKSTRLFPYLNLGFCYYAVPPCCVSCLSSVLVDYLSNPLHSAPLDPLAP